ncbi:MAG: class I SAM-dependent methyltransferase [Pseudomonadota bacterium]
MTRDPVAVDWVAARGEKWAAQLERMEAMLTPIDEPLLAALQLSSPCAIAEVGCGGGGTALKLAQQAPRASAVHGFDLSPTLIQLARARAAAPGLSFEVADMATAAPKQLYERLLSRFGVMFFDDPPAAFANLARWLAQGGRFAFAVWGELAENPWFTGVREVVAQVIDLPPSEPQAPGPFRYADPRSLLTLLERSGFAGVEVQEWQGPLAIGGGLPAPEAAEFALAAFSSFSEELAKAGQAAVQQAHQLLAARFSELEVEGVVRLDACVRVFTGGRA